VRTPAADLAWLLRAIEVSRSARAVSSRYAVGAVILDRRGRVLATGYTGEDDAEGHAEEAALAKLAGRPVDLVGATLYTSLEPCTTRRSRPVGCARLILAAGITRVVLAWREPALFADCDGVATLRRHGVEVVELGELADQARAVNSHLSFA
jgi:diaminohydroxyphosphoribosylaminopyrimidine deaminase / 5-amino-6-(5-phosphoribosylamino)uracil reductase